MGQITNQQVEDAFEKIFNAIHSRDFSKARRLHTKNERSLLLPIRFYLLGAFGNVNPEAVAQMPLGRQGRVDFKLGNTAIELAVKLADDPKSKLLGQNRPEMYKLIKHRGRSILVLFDFSKTRSLCDDDIIDFYGEQPTFGKGDHYRSPYTLLYYYRKNRQTGCFKRQIRCRQIRCP